MKAKVDRVFSEVGKVDMPNPPQGGWLRAARRAVGLSLKRLGKLSGRTAQSVKDAEVRELDGSISIGRLREIGAAMDMELVYGLVPRGGSVEELTFQRAVDYAKRIRQRTHQTMVLEDQAVYGVDEEKKVTELAKKIIAQKPDAVWQ